VCRTRLERRLPSVGDLNQVTVSRKHNATSYKTPVSERASTPGRKKKWEAVRSPGGLTFADHHKPPEKEKKVQLRDHTNGISRNFGRKVAGNQREGTPTWRRAARDSSRSDCAGLHAVLLRTRCARGRPYRVDFVGQEKRAGAYVGAAPPLLPGRRIALGMKKKDGRGGVGKDHFEKKKRNGLQKCRHWPPHGIISYVGRIGARRNWVVLIYIP